MTKSGWCRNNYHKDGKRRYGELVKGLCDECQKNSPNKVKEQIAQLLKQRASLNTRINKLRQKLLPEP